MSEPVGGIIVAGGKGLRMGASIPKQYIEIGGKPILQRTMEALLSYDHSSRWVVVVPEGDVERVKEMVSVSGFSHRMMVTMGGKSRGESVFNGLKALPHEVERVAIHDGVRPFVSRSLLQRLFEEDAPSVVPIVPSVDSLRRYTPSGSEAVDRNLYVRVQTPQVIERKLLEEAYDILARNHFEGAFTDDVSLVESLCGVSPSMVEGEETNIKITHKMDLALAEYILNRYQM